MTDKEPISQELVKDFVMYSHMSFDRVKTLCEKEPKIVRAAIDWGEGDWESGLDAASHVGNTDIAQYLLSKGAPLTVYCAAMLGQIDMVKAFIASDPNVTKQTGVHGISLLYHAVLSGKVELAELLEQHGSAPLEEGALRASVRSGNIKMVQWILDRGVTGDINKPNVHNKTPLGVAIEKGYDDIADLLRKHGAQNIQ